MYLWKRGQPARTTTMAAMQKDKITAGPAVVLATNPETIYTPNPKVLPTPIPYNCGRPKTLANWLLSGSTRSMVLHRVRESHKDETTMVRFWIDAVDSCRCLLQPTVRNRLV